MDHSEFTKFVEAENRFVYIDEAGDEISVALPYIIGGNFARSYDIIDFGGDSLPIILIHWDIIDLSRWGAHTISYAFDENFVFDTDGTFIDSKYYSMPPVYYVSSQGEIFEYIGDFGMYSGLFGTFGALHTRLEEDYMIREIFQDNDTVFITTYPFDTMDEDAVRAFMSDLIANPDNPPFPGRPGETLQRIESYHPILSTVGQWW
jgi:hypothetical protein